MRKAVAVITAILLALCICACEEVAFPDIQTIFEETPAGESGKKIKLDYKLDSIGEKSEPVKTEIPEGAPRVIGMTLEQSVMVIEAGTKSRIGYSVKPNTAYDKSVYFVSSDESIVKVDKEGYALGLKPGAVTVTVITNDISFKRSCTVIVNRNSGENAETNKLIELINSARLANGQAATSTANVNLQAAANQRAYEEAVDIVNYGETRMDSIRMQEVDGKREEINQTIFEQYNIWSKASMAVYVWGEYSAEQAYRAFIEDDACALALGVTGESTEIFDYIAAGYYEFDGISYWCILMTR